MIQRIHRWLRQLFSQQDPVIDRKVSGIWVVEHCLDSSGKVYTRIRKR